MSEQFTRSGLFFRQPGPRNTDALLEFAAQRFRELELNCVIMASCTGMTAEKALAHFDPRACRFVVVTHVTGFQEPDTQTMPVDVRARLTERGVHVLTTTHAFGGVGRAIRTKLGTFQTEEIVAHTLRLFGQGIKVCVEISLMAADAGLARTDENVLAIGGTGRGADTAAIVRPANAHRFLDARVREIVAAPW